MVWKFQSKSRMSSNNLFSNKLLEEDYPSCYGLIIRWRGEDDEYYRKHAKISIAVEKRGFYVDESINAKLDSTEHNSMRITTSLWKSTWGTYIEWPIFQAINTIFGEHVELIKLTILGYPIQEV